MRIALVLIACFTACLHAQAPAVPKDVIFERNVEFSNINGQSLALNIARPKEGSRLPAVLCIHGGGFRAGTREGYDKLCVEFAERGYVAATVTYRLAPASQLGLVDDVVVYQGCGVNELNH